MSSEEAPVCISPEETLADSVGNWIVANPGTAAAYGMGAVGLTAIAAPAVVAAPVLGAFGFGANGIIGGKAAHNSPPFQPPTAKCRTEDLTLTYFL